MASGMATTVQGFQPESSLGWHVDLVVTQKRKRRPDGHDTGMYPSCVHNDDDDDGIVFYRRKDKVQLHTRSSTVVR